MCPLPLSIYDWQHPDVRASPRTLKIPPSPPPKSHPKTNNPCTVHLQLHPPLPTPPRSEAWKPGSGAGGAERTRGAAAAEGSALEALRAARGLGRAGEWGDAACDVSKMARRHQFFLEVFLQHHQKRATAPKKRSQSPASRNMAANQTSHNQNPGR